MRVQILNKLGLNWARDVFLGVGTTVPICVILTTGISVNPASAADSLVSETHNHNLSSNQTPQEYSDIAAVVVEQDTVTSVKSETIREQKQPQLIAQTDSSGVVGDSLEDVNKLRQKLKIKPLLRGEGANPTYSPTLNFGIPSAFGANWGDFFLVASGANRKVAGNAGLDGSISAGFGLGDSQKLIGLEVAYNNGSIKNFGANGTFDLKAHRVVSVGSTNQISVAVGWTTFAQYGNEPVADSSVYGAVTNVSLLQPNNPQNQMPLAVTVGLGGGNFKEGNNSIGVFGGLGLQIHPQVGIGASWSGVALNAGISYIPVQTLPLTLVLQGSDLTDRTPGGTAVIFSVSYGFNFLPK